jgi:hypothetical protein
VSGQALLVSGVSVALDEAAREVSERQVFPARDLRERFEQRPITTLRRAYSLSGTKPTNPLERHTATGVAPAYRCKRKGRRSVPRAPASAEMQHSRPPLASRSRRSRSRRFGAGAARLCGPKAIFTRNEGVRGSSPRVGLAW